MSLGAPQFWAGTLQFRRHGPPNANYFAESCGRGRRKFAEQTVRSRAESLKLLAEPPNRRTADAPGEILLVRLAGDQFTGNKSLHLRDSFASL